MVGGGLHGILIIVATIATEGLAMARRVHSGADVFSRFCQLLDRFLADCDPKAPEPCLPLPRNVLRVVQFTVTIGDWGDALDDVFEVWFDGAPVLAPAAPVRSASITFETYAGAHTVLLIGKTIPDQIGTYEISFSPNVIVISGPSQKGANLGEGVTFAYRVMVG
jgi:hypothetical protein